MKKVVLISCVSKKLSHKAKTRDLYISPLFRLGLRYARSLNPDKIFILSAEYGLLSLEQEIEPYNKTLNKMTKERRREWGQSVVNQLRTEIDLEQDEVVFLAGKRYREFLTPYIKNYKVPMERLGIGKQLKFLKQNT